METAASDARPATRFALAILLGGLLVVSGPAVRADDLCGATIVEDVKLHHDLVCAGVGLIVGADGISINLNGHTIAALPPTSESP